MRRSFVNLRLNQYKIFIQWTLYYIYAQLRHMVKHQPIENKTIVRVLKNSSAYSSYKGCQEIEQDRFYWRLQKPLLEGFDPTWTAL